MMATEGIENFNQIVSALAGVAAVFVGAMGLTTWKNQIRWNRDHDLARRILVDIFMYRDAFSAARSRWFPSSEMLDSGETASFPDSDEISHQRTVRAHTRRVNRFQEIKSRIYSHTVEAEVLWGNDLGELWKNIVKLESEYIYQLERHLESSDPRNRSDRRGYYSDESERLKGNRIVFFDRSDEDYFDRKLSNEVSAISQYLREKIGETTP